jgi:hypothetical protein
MRCSRVLRGETTGANKTRETRDREKEKKMIRKVKGILVILLYSFTE